MCYRFIVSRVPKPKAGEMLIAVQAAGVGVWEAESANNRGTVRNFPWFSAQTVRVPLPPLDSVCTASKWVIRFTVRAALFTLNM